MKEAIRRVSFSSKVTSYKVLTMPTVKTTSRRILHSNNSQTIEEVSRRIKCPSQRTNDSDSRIEAPTHDTGANYTSLTKEANACGWGARVCSTKPSYAT